MVMVSKFLNFPNELSENDELRKYELSGSDCSVEINAPLTKSGIHQEPLSVNGA